MPEPASGPTWPALLTSLLAGEDLATHETHWAMGQVMAGEATPAQLAGFVTALRAKGETTGEVLGLATAMLDHAPPVDVEGPIVDTCGTGGDRAHTVNISTMAAIVVAATGAKVVKHGNRAASSACGSADLLEALGVAVDLGPYDVATCVGQIGIGFCFAPVFHAGMRHAATARRELGVPTVFNFLGPLTNPARPSAQAVGVSDPRIAPVMAGVLAQRGTSAVVFRGNDGLDELSTATMSRVWITRHGGVDEEIVNPVELGIPAPPTDGLRGADAAYNAEVARRLFAGDSGPVRDAVLLNAAAALVALDPGDVSLTARLREGMTVAATALDNGAAGQLLERWVQVSHELVAMRR
jgi:anthranilate phosphoribosyltransferase